MATSKTLAPTNVTISIPAMTDAPNASVMSNCIDKEADAINTLNSQITTKIGDFYAVQLNYGTTITVTSKGVGNRAGIVIVGEGASCSLWAFTYRSANQTVSIVKIGGNDNRTLSATVTSTGVITITASTDCHMDVMMSI